MALPKKPAAKAAVKAAPAKAGAKPAGKVGAKAPLPRAAAAKTGPATTITMKQLGAELATQHDMPKKTVETVLADLVSSISEHLKSGERIRIVGLGILEVKNRPARMGRNPATGEAIQVKASKKVAFRAAKELKEAV